MIVLDLPAELLHAVVKEAIPESFEALAITCRHFHEHCKPFLAKYNQLRRQFHNFRYRTSNQILNEQLPPSLHIGDKPPRTSFELVQLIAEEPIIARYIVNADFWGDDIPPYQGDFDESSYEKACKARRQHGGASWEQRILGLLQQSSYLRGLDPHTLLEYMIREQHHDVNHRCLTRFFILTLLPNVRKLELSPAWSAFSGSPTRRQHPHVKATWTLFESLIDRAASPSDCRTQSSSIALSMLERLFTTESYSSFHEDFQSLSPFLSLPRLRSLHASNFSASLSDITDFLHPRYDSFGASLQDMRLERSTFDAATIAALLKPCKSLKAFRFNFKDDSYHRKSSWDPAMFVANVAGAVGMTLEKLSLTIHTWHGGVSSEVVNLKDFEILQEAEIDTSIFIKPIRRLVPIRSRPMKSDEEWEPLILEGARATPSLQQLLPPSVRKLLYMSISPTVVLAIGPWNAVGDYLRAWLMKDQVN